MAIKFPPAPPCLREGEQLTEAHEDYIVAAYALEKGANWIAKRLNLLYPQIVYAVLKRRGIPVRTRANASKVRKAGGYSREKEHNESNGFSSHSPF